MDRRRPYWISGLFVLMLLVGTARVLWAHAILMESTPKPGSVVGGPTLSIILQFNVRVDGSRSRVRVALPDGSITVLQIGKQSSPDSLECTATNLKPGAHRVIWQVLASDGHITRGDFPFTVK